MIEMTNSATKMKKTNCAISVDAAAMPPNPMGSKPAQPGAPQQPPVVTDRDFPQQPGN